MVVLVLLTVGGFQLPVMPLLETEGNEGADSPLHTGGTALNVGVMELLTVIANVVLLAH